MRRHLFLILLTLSATAVKAQSDTATQAESGTSIAPAAPSTGYRGAVGLKIWDGAGLSFKYFLQEARAGELIFYFFKRGYRLTGLYERYYPLGTADGLAWYWGFGGHFGSYKGLDGDHDTYIGIDGVIGLDYKFRTAPVNLSLDWQPAFEFGNGAGFQGGWGGLGIRYAF